jgi:hypothetical protein
MKWFAAGGLALVLFASVVVADDPKVTLVPEKESVKVLIGDDVFTVLKYGKERRKPFFLPVTGPGGWELLKAAVAEGQPGSLSRKVVIASETAPLTGTQSNDEKMLRYGDIAEITEIKGNKLKVGDGDGWIQRSDVAPLAATVIRPLNEDPAIKKDLISDDKYDHPHHKGIWFSVDEINRSRHWMERDLVQNQQVELEGSGTDSARLKLVNNWLDEKGQLVLIEKSTVTFHPNRLIEYDAELIAAVDDLHIGDTKEGMFAIRVPASMKEKGGGGIVTNSDGLKTTKECWGKTADWVNYDGPIEGHMFGVTIMDAPQNPWRSRYHVRDYGLFSVNPFGAGAYTGGSEDKQPPHDRTLKKGESLRFKYGAWIHGPNVTPEQINEIYKKL